MADDEETRVRQRLFRVVETASPEGAAVSSRPDPSPRGPVDSPASRSGPPFAPSPDRRPPPPLRPGPPGWPDGSGTDPTDPWPSPERADPWSADDRADAEPAGGRPQRRHPVADAADGASAPDSDEESAAVGWSRLPGPGAFDPGRRGIRALAAVAVVVVLGAGFWAWRSRPQSEPVPPAAAVPAPGVSATPGPATTAGADLVVAVAGKVRRPGLVRVPPGARVADAVQAAGGALPGVDVALLNPARKVTDGELVLVGVTAPPGQAAPAAGPPAAGAAPAPGGRLNLNTATLAQLDALPGVGPVLAQRILTHRDQHGGFGSVGDLRQVDGIGDARYEQLKDLVTV